LPLIVFFAIIYASRRFAAAMATSRVAMFDAIAACKMLPCRAIQPLRRVAMFAREARQAYEHVTVDISY